MSWDAWLDEHVKWDINNYTIKRRAAIHKLCKYGLIPFLQSHGYSVGVDDKELGSRIATGLYNNQNKTFLESDWNFGSIPNELLTEEYEMYFNHHINDEEWDKFWELWGVWSDVDKCCQYGAARQQDIRQYMWSQLNSNLSAQMIQLKEKEDVEENAYEYDTGDAYLRDAKESGEWGGIRK